MDAKTQKPLLTTSTDLLQYHRLFAASCVFVYLFIAGLFLFDGKIFYLFDGGQPVPSDITAGPVTPVTTIADWKMQTKNRQVVVFVDAKVNSWTKFYKDRFDSYAQWFRSHSGYDVLFVDTSCDNWEPESIEPELYDHLQQLWKTHSVITGGYKTWGGAGTVAWLDNGVIVDHELIGATELDTLGKMKSRTFKAFPKLRKK